MARGRIVPRRTSAALLIAALAGWLAAVPAARAAPPSKVVSAASPSKGTPGPLSPRLQALASARLGKASLPGQARALSLPAHGPGSLLRRANRILVDVRFASLPASRLGRLRATGASTVFVSPRYRTVTAAVLPSQLEAVARVPGVESVTEDLTPVVARTATPLGATRGRARCPSGAVVSEGDVQLKANAARSSFGVKGSGVKVGVLSDSFRQDGSARTTARQDVRSGDLPGSANPCGFTAPVQVLADSPKGADEGRAMLQIVHDLAPGAHLAFATAFRGELDFAHQIRRLRSHGADVLVDDVAYLDEPFFQNGPISVAADDVTAGGVAYFSAAGNNNVVVGGHDAASFEAPAFRTAGTCPAAVQAQGEGTQCMDFDPGSAKDTTYGITVGSGSTLRVDLQWAQPWFGVTTDLDAFLLDSKGTILATSAGFNVSSTQKPFEFLAWTNFDASSQNVNVVIPRYTGGSGGDMGTPRLKLILAGNGANARPNEYTTSSGGDVVGPAIFGHNGAPGATTVAAVPFNDSNTVEPYSSHGPVTLRFGPVTGTTPAQPIAPQTVDKPDLAATDCGKTTFFEPVSSSTSRFCGTSAAAPHAAAVAALMLDADSAAGTRKLRNTMASTASPVGSFGAAAAGAGLINARKAVARLIAQDTTKPTARMELPSRTVNRSQKVRLAWHGSDGASGSGIKDFDVRVRRARFDSGFGSFSTPAALRHTTHRSATFAATSGSTYCFSVRARDRNGNVSRFSPERCTETPVDDDRMKGSAGWSRRKGQTGAYLRTLSVASSKGASLRLSNVRARRLGVMMKLCPACGSIRLRYGSTSSGPISLRGSGFRIFSFRPFHSTRKAAVTVTVITSGERVRIDGVVALRTGTLTVGP